MQPIATYRDERQRLVLLTDLGPEHGIYAMDGASRASGRWMAMRCDVALKLVQLGRAGAGPNAGATVRLFVRETMDYYPRSKGAWQHATRDAWRRLPAEAPHA